MAKRKYILIRHYCEECGGRVVPFDKFDDRTESPIAGKDGPLLLKSYNHAHREERIAWCFSCKQFQAARRMTEADILTLYAKRKGVRARV